MRKAKVYVKGVEAGIALPLMGKKKHLTRSILVDYFGAERCELTTKSIDNVMETIFSEVDKWKKLIEISFLSNEMKGKYQALLETRLGIMRIR